MTQLGKNLLSHSQITRQSSLELLTSSLSPLTNAREVLRRCLAAESVPLTVQGVRERILRIGRVPQVVQDENDAGLCAKWLIGAYLARSDSKRLM